MPQTARAIQMNIYGGPEVLRLVEVSLPPVPPHPIRTLI